LILADEVRLVARNSAVLQTICQPVIVQRLGGRWFYRKLHPTGGTTDFCPTGHSLNFLVEQRFTGIAVQAQR
jgi:hypothetical protein